MKKLVLVLVLVLAFALPVFANPFVDVPLNHWAYDSVQSLAAKGVIVGYPDGTFGGAKSLTRYEFAEAVAKALAFVETQGYAVAGDVAILEKLAIEFADELASLGVTVADLEAALGTKASIEAVKALEAKVATLETFFEPVKITGSFEASYELPSDTNIGVLTDETIFNIAATINDKTTAGVKLTIADILFGAATPTWSDFFIDYQGDKAQLRVGDVDPATIALGLIYDYDTSEGFDGGLMTWNMMSGAWTGFVNVDVDGEYDYFTVNADFGDFGVTASYDESYDEEAADPVPVAYVGGVDLAYALNEDTTLAVEAAVFSVEAADLEYAAAATLGTSFADVTFALDGHYVTDKFAPTEGSFDADRMGGGVEATFAASEDVSLTVGYDYDLSGVEIDTKTVETNKVSGELGLTFEEITATVTAGYNFINDEVPAGLTLVYDKVTVKLTSDDVVADPLVYVAYAEYAGYALTDDMALSLDYQFESDTKDNTAVATLVYTYSEVLIATLEGRYDSIPVADMPVYSVEITLDHALAENTTLSVGYELNDWDDDEDSDTYRNILDDVGTLTAELSVSF